MHRHIDLLGDVTRPCVLKLSHRVEVKSSRLRSSNIKIVAELLFINWKVFSLGYNLVQDGGVLTLCWMTVDLQLRNSFVSFLSGQHMIQREAHGISHQAAICAEKLVTPLLDVCSTRDQL